MRSDDGPRRTEGLPIGWRRMYPELMRWGTDWNRRRALEQGRRDAFRGRWATAMCFWILSIGVIMGALFGAYSFGGSHWVRGSIQAASGPIVSIAYLIWQRQRVRTSLRRQLVSIGRLVCTWCGYDLRGDVSGRCPECGAGVE